MPGFESLSLRSTSQTQCQQGFQKIRKKTQTRENVPIEEDIGCTGVVLHNYNKDITKNWFISFEAVNQTTGQTIRKQFRGGMNYYKTLSKRERAAKKLVQFWEEKIKDGYNPFYSGLNLMDIPEALTFALSNAQVSPATKKAYKTTVGFISKAVIKKGLTRLPVIHLKRQHIKILLEQCKKANAWSNVAYNKHRGYLRALLGHLIEWEVIEFNPCNKIKTLPTTETQKFVPYTEKEKKIIGEHIYKNHFRYYVILMCVYHCGIRPNEVLALKIKDIDLNADLIKIVPDMRAANSKTKTIRKMPINKHLKDLLLQLHLENYDKELFVFGSPHGIGKSVNALSADYFTPSDVRVKRDTITKLWNKIVMVKLGINKYQYSMKHTGSDDKILAGIPLDALKEMYGHSSKYMTEKYVSVLKEIHRKQIRDNSPAF